VSVKFGLEPIVSRRMTTALVGILVVQSTVRNCSSSRSKPGALWYIGLFSRGLPALQGSRNERLLIQGEE
jgi:hypothetical protein